MQNYTDTKEVQVFVRSEQTTALHNVEYFILAYLTYASILALDLIYVVKSKWSPSPILFSLMNGLAFVIILILFVGACDWTGMCSKVKFN
jgi:hypothetical protein